MMIKILLSFYLFAAALTFFDCGKKGENPPNPSIQNSPLGVRVEADAPVEAEKLNAIDAALTAVFSDARAQGYGAMLNHSDYAIFVNRKCIDRNGVKAWLTRADNYDGTEYDQNPQAGIGEIYAAEQVVKNNNIVVPRYIICDDSLNNIANTARYGAEHVILWYNEPFKYLETETHRTGGHPLIPVVYHPPETSAAIPNTTLNR